MSTGEVSESEVDRLMAAGWVLDTSDGYTHWLHREHAPVFAVPTDKAVELQRKAAERGYAEVVGLVNEAVMARLRAPFMCVFIPARGSADMREGRWRIADANDDAIASCAAAEEGYARLIVQALDEHFAQRSEARTVLVGKLESHYCGEAGFNSDWNVGNADLIKVLDTWEGKNVRIIIEVEP
jgi:hypothetical protein